MLYPLDRLPIVPVVPPSNERDNDDNHVRRRRTTLTADERDGIQCVYLWLQAYSTVDVLPPPSPQPTYAELWFILKYFRKLQLQVDSEPPWCEHIVAAHAARYLAAVEGELPRGACAYSFREMGYWPAPYGIVGNCAAALAPPSLPAVTPPFGPTASSSFSAGENELAAHVAAMEL
jgi:hypothetical protein